MIVTRPVQAEIDKQKGGGNTRLSKRARATSSIFRNILLSEEKYHEVRSSKPTVRLYLRQNLRPDESLLDQLSYTERDDQLVGITFSFAKSHSEYQVFLLTHDTGPMTSADMVGVNFLPIPDEWLMAPETSETDKQITKLQAELNRLKKMEPNIEIHFENNPSEGTNLNKFERTIYSPLTESQISILIERIMLSIPVEIDFGPNESKHDNESEMIYRFATHVGITRTFSPATQEEISAYKDKNYPDWVEKCKEYLRGCHKRFNNYFTPPRVTVSLSNIGTRPAEDTLVTLLARGDFYICPPPYKDTEGQENITSQPSLPRPPKPPKGEWKTRSLFDSLSSHRNIQYGVGKALHNMIDVPSLISSRSRDPNAFYYQNRPENPVKTFSLECKQWRHQSKSEEILTDLFFNDIPSNISGSFEIKAHAANMADPVSAQFPIQITVNEVSAITKAEMLVEELINENQFGKQSSINTNVKN